MNRAFIALFVAALLASGCNDPKKTPGGPGATNPTGKTPVVGQTDNSFTLDVPNLSTSIKQGETKMVSIGIKRGKNFDQDVALKLDGLPAGLTADPAAPWLKKGEEEAKFNLKAADDAAVGDFTVKVQGKPAKDGATAANEFKITVDKK